MEFDEQPFLIHLLAIDQQISGQEVIILFIFFLIIYGGVAQLEEQ